MSKMGEELDKRLDEAKYDMYEALKMAEEDINWMLNNRQFLNPDVFDYIKQTLAKVEN